MEDRRKTRMSSFAPLKPPTKTKAERRGDEEEGCGDSHSDQIQSSLK